LRELGRETGGTTQAVDREDEYRVFLGGMVFVQNCNAYKDEPWMESYVKRWDGASFSREPGGLSRDA
tara:strand:+ start:526 stop:726 length:201 start_codon:yes stop_codon:yes gene_type:complete